MYYDQHIIENDEQTYKESNEEGCQEMLDCLPISCTMLIREFHDQNTNNNSEKCFEKTNSHLENTEPTIEETPTHIESFPLCYNSVPIIQQEWHPDYEKKITHEPNVQTRYHNNHEEFSETQEDQEIREIP